MNKFKVDNPCNLKLWLVYLLTIIFPSMQRDNFAKMG